MKTKLDKFLIVTCLFFANLASAADVKRDVAQESMKFPKIKIFEGTSTAYKFLGSGGVVSIGISGQSARLVWTNQLNTIKGVVLTNDEDTLVTQKVGANITCEKIYDKESKKSEYQCSFAVEQGGNIGPGAAG